jgi:hypothetical protein
MNYNRVQEKDEINYIIKEKLHGSKETAQNTMFIEVTEICTWIKAH